MCQTLYIIKALKRKKGGLSEVDPKMDIRTVELYLERTFSKHRKEMSGKGALSTKVRIVDDVIFVKMKNEFSGLAMNLFKYISDKKEEAAYYASVREESKSRAEKVLHEVCPLLNIRSINFRIDIENGFSFTIVVLNDDLEKMIRDGKITKPNQMLNDPQFVCSCNGD